MNENLRSFNVAILAICVIIFIVGSIISVFFQLTMGELSKIDFLLYSVAIVIVAVVVFLDIMASSAIIRYKGLASFKTILTWFIWLILGYGSVIIIGSATYFTGIIFAGPILMIGLLIIWFIWH